MTQATMRAVVVRAPLLLLAAAVCLLPQETQASGLRRLRKETVQIPDLARNHNNNNNKDDGERDAGFENLEAELELEDLFLKGIFRQLEGESMSFDMSMGGGSSSSSGSGVSGGGGSSSNGGSSSGGSSGGDSGGSGGESNGGDGGGSGGESGGDGGDDGSDVFKKCGISEQRRSDMLLDTLSGVSSQFALEDMSTAQYNARYWLDKDDKAMICPGNDSRVVQRYIAGLIYFQFGGDNWLNCRAQGGSCFQEDSTSVPAIPFLDESHECLWFGLSCTNVPREVLPSQRDIVSVDDFQPIMSVDISDNSLSGDMFVELFLLTKLQELTLDGNKAISGSIPEEIGQLTDLIAVDIDDNSLTGTLPSSLYTLTSLEAIDLNSNSLTGTISNEIGNLRNLVVVQLDNNDFTGPMPTDGLFELQALGK